MAYSFQARDFKTKQNEYHDEHAETLSSLQWVEIVLIK